MDEFVLFIENVNEDNFKKYNSAVGYRILSLKFILKYIEQKSKDKLFISLIEKFYNKKINKISLYNKFQIALILEQFENDYNKKNISNLFEKYNDNNKQLIDDYERINNMMNETEFDEIKSNIKEYKIGSHIFNDQIKKYIIKKYPELFEDIDDDILNSTYKFYFGYKYDLVEYNLLKSNIYLTIMNKKIEELKKSSNTPIDGLFYYSNIFPKNISKITIDQLDADTSTEWKPITSSLNSRLVKQYGKAYNYKKYTANEIVNPIPPFLKKYMDKALEMIQNDLHMQYEFDQCIVNNYKKGQSISKHVDSNIFDHIIACFTVGDGGIMRFKNINDGKQFDINVESNSLYIMSGESRYNWTHEMLKHKGDRRISITFRKIK